MRGTAKSVSCVLIGDESLLVECAQTLLDRDHSIQVIMTGNEQIAQWAGGIGLTVIAPGDDMARQLEAIDYDWFFSIANLRMLPGDVWRKARIGAVNFHDGPLPRFAGLNTPAWAIMAGEPSYGVTWHALADGADTGEIYVQQRFDIHPDETSLTLNTKCFEAGIASFGVLLDMIENGTLVPQPQDAAKRSYFGKHARPRGAATINFSSSTAEIDRLCRALNFGANYANPLCLPKLATRRGAYSVTGIEVADASGAPGKVVSSDANGVVIATADGAVRVIELADPTGKRYPASAILQAGEILPETSQTDLDRITSLFQEIVPYEAFFSKAIERFRDIDLHGLKPAVEGMEAQIEELQDSKLTNLAGQRCVVAIAAAFARMGEQSEFGVAMMDDRLAQTAQAFPGYIAGSVPLTISLSRAMTVGEFEQTISRRIAALRKRHTYPADLISRNPRLTQPSASIAFRLTEMPESAAHVEGAAITFVVPAEQGHLRVLIDRNRLPRAEAESLIERVHVAASAFYSDGNRPVADLPLMSPEGLRRLLYERNQTVRGYDRQALVHKLIEKQADATPDAVAVICGDHSLTYAELDARANAVAQELLNSGSGPDKLIGIYMNRSVDLVVGAVAILKSGAAYVPLDPTYPADRVALMVEDSGLTAILTEPALASSVPGNGAQIIDVAKAARAGAGAARPAIQVRPDNLAYVIYTSGSTGRPKGVMVEHRNVVNFFAGMDDRIPAASEGQPVWLAVTSLSFDISVLELFWTLTRGFKVVVHVNDTRGAAAQARRRPKRVAGGMDFSLFYWGHDDATTPNKYHLLLDGARFADTHGFRAIWTPERHFHAFGGPYPNPSVTGAAVASITRNIDIRAGSCVLPLHHPARVAEEWAVIDNISNGRAALAVASGWMPEDFLLRPENAPPHNKAAMIRDIDVLRRLWRGEKVAFPAPDGKSVEIRTQPRPVQSELPIWVTTAGNPETYREAARLGANVLTHLLGQSIAELEGKIRIYREALAENGRNPDDYTVTLMLHTLVGADRDQVRDQARQPMKDYLRSAAALIKQYAWAFPAFKRPQGAAQAVDIDLQSLDEEELDAILEFAFLRYFDDSGLFGTVDDAVARAEQLKAIGVDEIACLIDFGISDSEALRGLEPLADAVARVNTQIGEAPAAGDTDQGVAALIARHGVSHMQCTPSMATMMLVNEDDRQALGNVRHLFIGGEALQGALLRDLRSVTQASVENMYGPTETTIWSSTGPAGDADATVPLGTPIANTQLYILDADLRPVARGLPGELLIGGDGVTRGYLNREDLTAERFLPNPFVPGGRMYRTGDLVRIGPAGEIQFIGRTDHQVKVRGYRIELGEIEARIGLHPAVAEAVVVVREDKANDARIVAYVRYKASPVPQAELSKHVRAALPEFMVPVHFVTMEKFPLTPNAKVDRKALPRPGDVRKAVPSELVFVVPSDEVQQKVAEAFKRVLGIERVGATDNFFELGGHSLLAVQVHRDLKKNVAPQLSITDLYRFPTVAGLAAHIQGGGQTDKELGRIADRAAMRRSAMTGRRAFASRGRETS
jgi:natural product biosynthesis luciferase-like monooxygenase protein